MPISMVFCVVEAREKRRDFPDNIYLIYYRHVPGFGRGTCL